MEKAGEERLLGEAARVTCLRRSCCQDSSGAGYVSSRLHVLNVLIDATSRRRATRYVGVLLHAITRLMAHINVRVHRGFRLRLLMTR